MPKQSNCRPAIFFTSCVYTHDNRGKVRHDHNHDRQYCNYQPYALFHQLEGLEVEVGCIQLSRAVQKLGFGSPLLPDGDHCHDKFFHDLDDAVVGHLFQVEHEEAKDCITDEQFSSLLRKYGGKSDVKKIIGSSRNNPHHMVINAIFTHLCEEKKEENIKNLCEDHS